MLCDSPLESKSKNERDGGFTTVRLTEQESGKSH